MKELQELRQTGFDMDEIRARMAQNDQYCIDTINKPRNALIKKQLDGLGISFSADKSPRLRLSEVSSIVSDKQAEIILELLEGVN